MAVGSAGVAAGAAAAGVEVSSGVKSLNAAT